MSEHTNIAWADSTFNPWIGCTKVGPGCDGCYAEALMDARYGRVKWGPGQPRSRTSNAYWRKPLAWNGQPFVECMECGWRGAARDANLRDNCAGFDRDPGPMRICPVCDRPTLKEASRHVFCASLCDVFDNEVPDEWHARLFELIYLTPNLTWMLLTKRIGNVSAMAASGLPHNVWIGATVVNQEEAERDIPKLLTVPAAVRFLSIEPMLGPIDLGYTFTRSYTKAGGTPCVDWIIVGGESAQPGHDARPFNLDWARDIVRQCKEAGVPVFVKQLGSDPVNSIFGLVLHDRAGADPSEWPADLRVREFPK